MRRFVGIVLASLIIASVFIALEAVWDYFHDGLEPFVEYAVDAAILALAFCVTDFIMSRRENRK